ncbi:MAG TPA: pyridoxal phosphate-dependent aminotransferase [Kofleriaceae bacterium]|nr:pyridoxal phosphate-dependent aminotransferase [Kofleriaceae bacterium]
MGEFIDKVPLSGIIRVRELMFSVKDPYRLDQGDVSFDAPDTFKQGIVQAIEDNHTHYMITAGAPRLRELCAQRIQTRHKVPVRGADDILVTNGGLHGLYLLTQCLLEPGDEVIINDPTWPPFLALVLLARATPVVCPLHEELGWRYDIDELRSKITPKTKLIYLNSPQNPTGGVLPREDLEQIAAIAREHDVKIISDEAYEDYVFDGAEHVSIASLPDMYERTFPVYTFSKSFAVTGLRLGYVAVKDDKLRSRMMKMCFYTTSNVSSAIQYGGIAALEGDTSCVDRFVAECKARRDIFFKGVAEAAPGVFSGEPPKGGMFAFLKIGPEFKAPAGESVSWAMTEHLIKKARIGNVPGVDFSPTVPSPRGEGYIRFCFARERPELIGALREMAALFGGKPPAV